MKLRLKKKNSAKSPKIQKIQEYSNLRLWNHLYSKGDVAQILENSDSSSYATILKILWNKNKDQIPQARIRWFFKPKDIYSNTEMFSQNELFDSNFIQNIDVTAIYGKAKVLSLDEYLSHTEGDNIFFTRAKWNIKTKELKPPVQKWKKVCNCNQIYNPDRDYEKCMKCKRLFHKECIGWKEGIVCGDCEG
ncbi:unnamed protein product [Blepharisma stoltei]|uniref:BAH domain-containing protein n=1 Tax=Blepharisma stoltei TaxID=1481888 RepID=A0AAU9K4W4_9CILI|nr:unnamed protein product [Blepharisma stoltei]